MKRDAYGLDGFSVVLTSVPDGASEFPLSPYHLIGLNVGSAVQVVLRQGGRTYRGVHAPLEGDIVPAGTLCSGEAEWSDADRGYLAVRLAPAFLAGLAAQCDLNLDQVEVNPNFHLNDPHIAHLGLLLKDDLDSGGLGGRLYGESLATALGIHLLRRHTAAPQNIPEARGGLSPARLRRVTEYIHAHLDEDLSLSDLAGSVGLGPSQFRALFKQSTGLAPHQYVVARRVERAQRLLLRGGVSVGQAAAEAGFADQSHLTRHMRRLLGVTPRRLLDR